MEKNPLAQSNASIKQRQSIQSSEGLQLTGSQMNLTSRSQKSLPRSPNSASLWKSRPCSALQCYSAYADCKSKWKRPMSADNDLTIGKMLKDGARQCNSNTLRCSLDEGDPLVDDPNFKHFYTYMSAKLLKSLVRNPWNSDCSESVSNESDNSQSDKSLGCLIREMAQSNSDYSFENGANPSKDVRDDSQKDKKKNSNCIQLSSIKCPVSSKEKRSTIAVNEKASSNKEQEKSELRDLKFQKWFPQANKEKKLEEKIVRFSHEQKEDDELRHLIISDDEEDEPGQPLVLKSKAELEYNPENFTTPESSTQKDDCSTSTGITEAEETTDPKSDYETFTAEVADDVCHYAKDESEESRSNENAVDEQGQCTPDCPFSCCNDSKSLPQGKKYLSESDGKSDETPEKETNSHGSDVERERECDVEEPSTEISTQSGLTDKLDEEAKDSTYNEIVSIINVLEQEETDLLLNQDHEEKKSPRITRSKTSEELQDIYSYLDEVEKSSQDAINVAKSHLESVQTATKSVLSSISSVPRLEDLLSKSTVELAHEVLSLKLQVEEQSGGIKLLQTTIAEMKESAKIAKAAHKDEIFKVRNDAEVTLQRHQKFIKQLLQEKKVLNDKVGKLVEELKSGEERYQRNLKTIEQRHAIEIQRVKETQAVAEKLKREKWIDTKTQKIKEMTVKGLEPELSRMAARQQQELTELRNLHRAELEAVELRATRRTTELLDQLRADLTKDREEAILRETNTLRTKLEKQFEEERNRFEHEARKMREERRREKELLEAKETQLQDAYAEMKRSLEREKERERQRVMQEFQEQMESAKRRHQNEIKSVRDTLEIEKEAWMNNYKKQQNAKFLEREAELHHQYKRDRDRDIELVIEKFENESTQAQQELSQAAENKFKRMKEKFEEEIKEMEATEATLKTKLSETKSQLLEKDDQIAELKSRIHHLQTDLNQLKKLCEEMSAERSNLKQVIIKEFEGQLDQAEKEQEELRNQIVNLKTNHILELAKKDQEAIQAKAEAKQELNHVYNRVKLTVNKKEEALEVLRQQHKTVLERCSHLEKMLENQRKNFLLK